MGKHNLFLIVLLAAVLCCLAFACSSGDDDDDDNDNNDAGDDDDDNNDDDNDDNDDDAVNLEEFPAGLAVASPLKMVPTGPETSGDFSPLSTDWTSAYDWALEQIEGLLSGDSPVSDAFTPELFLEMPGRAACYGPMLDYEDHPDGSLPNSGQLPTGDLGIWLETDDPAIGGTGDACAAAQLNAQMEGMGNQSLAALMSLASMIAVATDNGLALPAVGGSLTLTTEMNAAGIPDVTFTDAQISQPADGDYTYELQFEYTAPGFTHEISVTLSHTSGEGDYEYEGVLYYTVSGDDSIFHGGNCPETERVLNDSLAYVRDGESDLKTQSRMTTFCGAESGAVDASGQVDPDQHLVPPSSEGWSENFNIFVANFNPGDISGEYAYVWQAGSGDPNTRVFKIGINDNSPLDGEAYFGYGDQVWESDGSIDGFICNWCAPGSNHTMHDSAQRQFISFNEETGLFEQPDGGSDILYAPTNSCLYEGDGTFWYDRNLNMTDDETAGELTVSPADLFEAASGQTMAETIEGRGYTLPEAPGDWPAP